MSEEEPAVWALMVHGGAWAIPEARCAASEAGCVAAVAVAEAILAAGGSALDAVEQAVVRLRPWFSGFPHSPTVPRPLPQRTLEDNPEYDAGTGSVLTSAGTVEMDAMIMKGDLSLGAVAAVSTVKVCTVPAGFFLRRDRHPDHGGRAGGPLRLARTPSRWRGA